MTSSLVQPAQRLAYLLCGRHRPTHHSARRPGPPKREPDTHGGGSILIRDAPTTYSFVCSTTARCSRSVSQSPRVSSPSTTNRHEDGINVGIKRVFDTYRGICERVLYTKTHDPESSITHNPRACRPAACGQHRFAVGGTIQESEPGIDAHESGSGMEKVGLDESDNIS